MATSSKLDTMDGLPIVDLDVFLRDPDSLEAKQEAQNVGLVNIPVTDWV